MEALKKIDEIVAKILKAVVVALCGGIAFILMLRVFMRFTPVTFAMTWSDEIVEWMMAYMIFLTSALIMRDGQHFQVDLLQEKFKGTMFVRVLNFLIAIINLVFFCVFLRYALDLFNKANQKTPILRQPVQIAYASIVIGTALITVYCVRDLVVRGVKMVKGEDAFAKKEDADVTANAGEKTE